MATLAAEIVGDLPAMTEKLIERMRAIDESYRRLPLPELRRSVSANLENSVVSLAIQRPSSDAPAEETARRRAEQGVPLASVLQAYRLGFSVIWEAMVERAMGFDHTHMGELLCTASEVWAIVDAHSVVVTNTYRESMTEAARRDEQRRMLLLDALLEGRLGDWALLGGSLRALGLPDHGPYLVASAETPTAGVEGLPGAGQMLSRHGVRSAWRLRADAQVGLIAICRTQSVASVRSLLSTVATSRVGLSAEYDDPADTARALSSATTARRSLPPGTVGVAAPDDDPVATLLASSPEMSGRVARMLLRGVIEVAEAERRTLLATLQTWFATAGRPGEAARALFCHRNTVRNRLRRIELLTGRSLDDPRSAAELLIAVECLRLLEPDVLADDVGPVLGARMGARPYLGRPRTGPTPVAAIPPVQQVPAVQSVPLPAVQSVPPSAVERG